MTTLEAQLDAVIERVTRNGHTGESVPGVVAAVTDANGTIYEKAVGLRCLATAQPMTLDAVFVLHSMTKPITGTAVLQCAEEGLLDLDAPAATWVPEISQLRVIEGAGADGAPILRAPKRDITTRMLLLHTAGFGYPTYDATYRRLGLQLSQSSSASAVKESLMLPLLFDPGERWMYGFSLDWAGFVVESIRGQRLGHVMDNRVFAPLGMSDTAFALSPTMSQRLATMHQRQRDGALVAINFAAPQEPEIDLGGHGLFGTVRDYMKLLRMWLNDGAGDHGRVLKPETVRWATRNGLENQRVTTLTGIDSALSNDVEFFPGQPKSWAYTFMVNDEQAPTGRPAGALGWGGLPNLYYWIDRQNGIAGLWATQVLPFCDTVSFDAYLDFETTVYRNLASIR